MSIYGCIINYNNYNLQISWPMPHTTRLLLCVRLSRKSRRPASGTRGKQLIGTLSKDVFERRTSTGSEAFSLFICLDANKLVLLRFFPLLKTIYPKVSTKPRPNDAKSPLPVDVRRSKTLLLKLPNIRT